MGARQFRGKCGVQARGRASHFCPWRAPEPMSDAAPSGVRAGIRLSFAGTVAGGLLQFGIMAALARRLTPAEYGTYALCLAIVSLSTILVNHLIERMLMREARHAEPHTVRVD